MATTAQPSTGAKPAASLSNEEILRYSRHLIMPEVGMEGQLKLKNAKVLLIGTGGLGAPLGLYLAAAGVGKLGLVDFDVVDFTNLQRQVTFGTSDVGKPKSEAARARLANLNPDIQIQSFETQLTSANALELFKDFDVIVDGTDNFPTRYLVNDACILLGKPNVYGSIFRFEGQATVFGMPDGPCYRCLSRTASARTCAFLRGRWRARCSPRNRRLHPGDGNHQADSWPRRQSHRAFATV
jgi:molybdopterin/thiamine biosynthesis adenylyltransferase